MKKLNYLYIAPLFVLFSCNKMLDVGTPANTLYNGAVYSDSANVKAAVIGIYTSVIGSNTYSFGLTVWNALYADETTSTSYPTFLANNVSPSDDNVGYIWTNSYNTIYRANAVMEGLANATALTATTIKQATGEALFWRAYAHFQLLNAFGHIPLITTTNTAETAVAPQTTADAVYKQIIADLKQAADDLPADYSVSGSIRTRVNKFACNALLAKVYLYQGDWVNAEAQASVVIGSSLFNLPTDLTKVFLSSGTEAILQLDNSGGTVALASNFVPASGVVPGYIMRDELVNAFEAGDLRKTNWTGTSAGYYYPAKYKVKTTGSTEYLTVLRLADIYLTRAEARAKQNHISDAASDINAVRTRAGLGGTAAADQDAMLLAIERERRVEMFCEQGGHRFFDLKRTGRADAVLGAEKTSWTSTAVNYPIPSVEIGKNGNLKQNDGYH